MTERGPRSPAALAALAFGAAFLFAGFVALGIWQVDRRAWKLDLIDRVEQRVHASPVEAPGPDHWPQVKASADEYRRVRATGNFLQDRETLVQATTDLGSGYWVMTPLRLSDGSVVLINRGFVPPEQRDRTTRNEVVEAGESTVTGLLRMTEPRGSFLRHNDPPANRWYSRDVQAIAAARGLDRVAPYFIDAEAGMPSKEKTWPAGGLTVIAFQNNHFAYALTWFSLALMIAGAVGYVVRDELRLRQRRMREDPVSAPANRPDTRHD